MGLSELPQDNIRALIFFTVSKIRVVNDIDVIRKLRLDRCAKNQDAFSLLYSVPASLSRSHTNKNINLHKSSFVFDLDCENYPAGA